MIGYKQTLLLAALYDPARGSSSGRSMARPRSARGKTPLLAVASDYQESKNIDQAGNILPNTSFRTLQLRGRQAADRQLAAAATAQPVPRASSGCS